MSKVYRLLTTANVQQIKYGRGNSNPTIAKNLNPVTLTSWKKSYYLLSMNLVTVTINW